MVSFYQFQRFQEGLLRQLDAAQGLFDLISEPSPEQFKEIIEKSLNEEILLKLDGPYAVWQEVTS